ncbi:MAG: hypothetical protein ACPL7K_05455 [Armatimonadota bacterium]
MKKLSAFVFWATSCLLVVLLAIRLAVHIQRSAKGSAKELRLSRAPFPSRFLSGSVSEPAGALIVFISSDLDCEGCVLSWLKALNEGRRRRSWPAVQVIGVGELAAARYAQWARALHLDFAFVATTEDSLLEAIPGLEIPALIMLDRGREVVAAWKAEPVHLVAILARIEQYCCRQGS